MSGPSLHRLTLRGSLEEIKTIIQVSMLRDSNRQTCKKLKCMHRPTFCKECRTWRKKSCSISLASKIRFYHPYPDIKLEKSRVSISFHRRINDLTIAHWSGGMPVTQEMCHNTLTWFLKTIFSWEKRHILCFRCIQAKILTSLITMKISRDYTLHWKL